MKSIVGGVVYTPYKKQNLDIYGEPIDFTNLTSYIHQPVSVDGEIEGYVPRYTFNRPSQETIIETPRTGSHKIESGVQVGNMQAFLDEAAKHGVYFRVTSGMRPGAKTSSGKDSWHGTGEALDITPLEGQTWDQLRESFRSSPELIAWMQNAGYGILDETTADMLARTGGTGAHFHIGRDKIALEGLKQYLT